MKLTMPSYDVGAARVMVDGKQVGFALARFDDWGAMLWHTPDRLDWPPLAVVTAPSLSQLRVKLRERLAEHGPWWSEDEVPDGDR